MLKSLEDLNRVRRLAEIGQHAAVVDYLGDRSPDQLRDSPTLALLYGTAQARLGRQEEGTKWVKLALTRSRERGDRAIEARALNIRGAIALVGGSIDEAEEHLMQALAAAKRADDHATIGRCSNNLGIISNLRGRYAKAIGYYTMALAAFERAGLGRGLAETRPNLAITYRDQGTLERALDEASRAVDEAEDTHDETLLAQVLACRAEIRLLSGETKLARHEIDRALNLHRRVADEIEEAKDLRVVAMVLATEGNDTEAQNMLEDVIDRAERLSRPLLAADASRDLAHVLRGCGREADAQEAARSARVLFSRLGAEAEIRKLDRAFG
jgi:tetratricopeptide (TPR) repeat protein